MERCNGSLEELLPAATWIAELSCRGGTGIAVVVAKKAIGGASMTVTGQAPSLPRV
jgi:hypothetical protein